jgi:hypothetical protein
MDLAIGLALYLSATAVAIALGWSLRNVRAKRELAELRGERDLLADRVVLTDKRRGKA